MARKASASARKSAALGASFGSASHQLRKRLLFKYVQLAGDDICFKCGERIETVDEFSIEHKEPWEGRDPALFYDLNNIAFSHLRCNRPHQYVSGAIKLRKIGPEGTSWCIGHQDFLPVAHFTLDNRRWNKLSSRCRLCDSKWRPTLPSRRKKERGN